MRILGILNLTEDSFSDGNMYLQKASALKQACKMSEAGAWAIDLGAASSHPDAKIVPEAVELERLQMVLPDLIRQGVRISIDSCKPGVQRFALKNATIINDIHGFAHPELYPELAASDCLLAVMHCMQKEGLADRKDPDSVEVLDHMWQFFDQRLSALFRAGVAASRIILDPGMGFFLSSRAEVSLAVLNTISTLKKKFGLPVLVSVSRKSFLGIISGQPVSDRGAATLAAEIFARSQGVDFIRTHDVQALSDAIKVLEALS